MKALRPVAGRLLAWSAAPGLALLAIGAAAPLGEGRVLINETRSLPAGVYLRREAHPLNRGDIVAVAQPPSARPYLRSVGAPTGMLLLKRVGALAGDHVCRTGDRILLPPRIVPVRSRDHGGRSLPRWSDCRLLESDEVFLVGDTPGSFDSRYFGPVRITAVAGVYQGVILW